MSNNEDIKALIEKRVLEASDKNLMGDKGILASIARLAGEPIIDSGPGDFGEIQEGEILWDESEETTQLGWVYYGLGSGVDLKIKYFNETSSEIKVLYKGVRVYEELEGQLIAYAPSPDWEKHVKRLYESISPKISEEEKINEVAREKKISKEYKKALDYLKSFWGYDFKK